MVRTQLLPLKFYSTDPGRKEFGQVVPLSRKRRGLSKYLLEANTSRVDLIKLFTAVSDEFS